MAKNYYNVSFKSNFSFRKLGNKLDDVLGSSNEKIIDELAQMTKRNITDGKLRGLSQSTILARLSGQSSFEGHKPKRTSESRPLIYTGELLKSIKPVKDGIEMLEYGLEHHEGFTTPKKEIFIQKGKKSASLGSGKKVHPRKFIAGESDLKRDKKKLEEVQNELIVKMQMVMRTKTNSGLK
mgnify:FL=1